MIYEIKNLNPYLAVLLAVVAVAFSSIFTKLSDAPPLVIAFYRLLFTVLMIAPLAFNSGEMPALLKLDNISINFGGLNAVDSLSFQVEKGRVFSLIGPNGAGKSTVFNMISGIYRPTSGKIVFKDNDITGYKPYLVTDLGISRTFQNIRLFKNMTVLDNVRIGCHTRSKAGFLGALTRVKAVKHEEMEIIRRADEVLSVVDLASKREDLAKNLAYGEQRKLEIARALASSPDLMLLDEPAAGMNAQEKEGLIGIIKNICGMGITI